jgi:hypothetical protein
LYRLEEPTPLRRYALEFLLDACGFQARETAGDDYAVYHGGHSPVGARRVWIGTGEWREPAQSEALTRLDPRTLGHTVPFDLLEAVSAVLTDRVNAGATPDAFDIHGRLRLAASFQGRLGSAAVPQVNLYAAWLGQVIEQTLGFRGARRWPDGKTCALALSHDVDRLDQGGLRTAPLRAPNLGLRHNLALLRVRLRSVMSLPVDDFALFRELLDFEESHDFRSTFFFASHSRWGEYAAPEDVLYEVDTPRMRRLLAEMLARGFEIGLHASYSAYRSADRLRAERERLSQVARTDVRGVRHHYWHLGPEPAMTLKAHEEAGFLWDSSLAFNEDVGYRRGVALPYYPWDDHEQRPLRVRQLPVLCMDGALLRQATTVDDALRRFQDAIGFLRSGAGLGVIDWHSDAAHPSTPGFERWGQAYRACLSWLASQDDVWIGSLGNIAEWLDRRWDRQRE